jgi:catechol 2,3-dioxygenase-like lactoylglutathione lyase family enzyme
MRHSRTPASRHLSDIQNATAAPVIVDPKETSGPFADKPVRMTEHTSFQVRRADHVGFAVASLDEALRFWVDGLGARLVRTGEMGGEFLGQVTGAHGSLVHMAIVSLADQTIELLEYQGVDRPSAPAKPFDPGFAHLALVVDDIKALLVRIAAYGWKAQGTPQPITGGTRAGTLVIYVVGPDGATIEFMQPPTAVRNH